MKIRFSAVIALGAVLALASCSPGGGGSQAGGSSPSKEDDSQSSQQQVKPLPFNAGGLLGGTAKPEFPDGKPGGIVVVTPDAQANDNGSLVIAFRNNTGEAVSNVRWQGVAKSNGVEVAKGMSMSTSPGVVRPGEIGLAAIAFDFPVRKEVPKDLDFSLSINSQKADTKKYSTAPLKVVEAKVQGREVVGTVVNETGKDVGGPINVDVFCFNGNEMIGQWPGYLPEKKIKKGEKLPFTQGVFGAECPTFVVGVNGSFK